MNEQLWSGFIGALIGGFFALTGTIIILISESIKARKERKFNAKQDALLSAAESVTRVLGFYESLPDRTLPDNGTIPVEFSDMAVALNRLHFYCDLETIKQSMRLNQVLMKSFYEAMKIKLPLIIIDLELKTTKDQVDSLETLRDSIIEKMDTIMISGDSDKSWLKNLQKQFDINSQKLTDLYNKRVKLFEKKRVQTQSCQEVIRKNFKAIYESSRDVLLLARKELEFKINKEKYQAMINEQTDSAIKSTKEFSSEIQNIIQNALIDLER